MTTRSTAWARSPPPNGRGTWWQAAFQHLRRHRSPDVAGFPVPLNPRKSAPRPARRSCERADSPRSRWSPSCAKHDHRMPDSTVRGQTGQGDRQMFRLIFDTSALHQEGLASPRMQQLQLLIDAGRLELYVPSLVRREFHEAHFGRSPSASRCPTRMKSVSRRLEFNSGAREQIAAADATLGEIRKELSRQIQISFEHWSARMKSNYQGQGIKLSKHSKASDV